MDLAAATARRIAVAVTPGANAESVAEHVFALLLALTRNVLGNDRSIRAGGWDRKGLERNNLYNFLRSLEVTGLMV